jgi:hypothetical protein
MNEHYFLNKISKGDILREHYSFFSIYRFITKWEFLHDNIQNFFTSELNHPLQDKEARVIIHYYE